MWNSCLRISHPQTLVLREQSSNKEELTFPTPKDSVSILNCENGVKDSSFAMENL